MWVPGIIPSGGRRPPFVHSPPCPLLWLQDKRGPLNPRTRACAAPTCTLLPITEANAVSASSPQGGVPRRLLRRRDLRKYSARSAGPVEMKEEWREDSSPPDTNLISSACSLLPAALPTPCRLGPRRTCQETRQQNLKPPQLPPSPPPFR